MINDNSVPSPALTRRKAARLPDVPPLQDWELSSCKAAMKRKGLSKRTRFEVFKRDRFRCVYCGGTPPACVLVVDHVIPVASGGTNDIVNLVSSCSDCNSGKSDKKLSDPVSPGHSKNVALEAERLEQAKAFNDFLAESNLLKAQWFNDVARFWVLTQGDDPDRYTVDEQAAKSIRTFLKFLPAEEIKDSIQIAHDRLAGKQFYKIHRYFCGVCWTKIKGPKKGAQNAH